MVGRAPAERVQTRRVFIGELGGLTATLAAANAESASRLLPRGQPCAPLHRARADVQELVSLIEAGAEEAPVPGTSGVKRILRPSKVVAMLASRACRTAIMIGTALDKKEMYRLLRYLPDLDVPWICAHGRPTMRHLCVLPGRGG